MVANFTFLLDMSNYGQRLQNYALQEFFMNEFGETMVTMDYDPSRKCHGPGDDKFFHQFERDLMRIADIRSEGTGMLSDFDYIVLGGDQVFNTDFKWPWNMLPYLAERPNKRRNVFSYAAGVSRSHSVSRDFISKLELQMLAYGLREDCSGLCYVKNIDPVFLLMDRWSKIGRGEHPDGGTVEYMIGGDGGMSKLTRTTDAGADVFAAKPGPKVPDPREFVGLFRGASKVVTNSFHGLCFALMNKVPEIVVSNPDDHRVANLRKLLGIETHDGKISNYDSIFDKIRLEVAKSKDFVGRCLNSRPVDYCAYSKTRGTRDASTSGGAAPELAKWAVDRGGSVFGGAFSADFRKVVPVCVRSMEEYFKRLAKSKYSFCAVPDVDELKKELSTGHPVMYIGSPCHVAAVRRLLGEVPPNLFLVDFRCVGYSRPDKLERFVDDIESRNRCKVSGVDFRPDHKCEIRVLTDAGKKILYGTDKYRDFIYDTLPMCKDCRFAHGMGQSCADITLADFWENTGDRHSFGGNFTPEAGCSRVSVNTEKGRMMWFDVSRSMEHMPLLPLGRGGARAPRKAEGPDYMVWTSYHDDSQIKSYHLVNDAHHAAFPVHKAAVMRNVNYMNPVWSELVTLWYVYNNRIRHDIVGFSHYRRQIKPSRLPGKGECAIFTEFGVATPYLQYKASHSSVDMDEVLRILDRRYGIGNPYAIDIRNATKVIGCNCFMMTWDDFVGLCDFLFPVLMEYSDAVGCGMDPELWRARTEKLFKDADAAKIRYQTRVVGFLAERLVSAYIHTHMFFYY